MNRALGPSKDSYDVIVVGAGLAGLTCGALLAKDGMSVLVVDQRPVPGGVCHSYQRGGFTFDVGPHLLSGCAPGWVVHSLLTSLGVEGEAEFIPVNPLARAIFPNYEVDIPANYQSFTELLAGRFPQEKQRLLMLFREMGQMYADVDALPASFSLWDYLKVPVNHPIFTKYPSKTFAQMVDQFLLDDELKSVVSALWVYFGLPPSKISAVFWTVVMMSYFVGGGFYPRGGIGRVAQALAKGLENQGGELLLNTMAERIMVEDRRAVGVELVDVSARWLPDGRLAGQEAIGERFVVTADTVVSGADARLTFERLVGEEHLPSSYRQALRRMEPSLSLIKVALGVDMDLESAGVTHHDTIFFDTYDMDQVYHRMRAGLPEGPCDMTVPTVTDPTLAPSGQHCLYLWNYVPFHATENWQEEGPPIAARMISWAGQHIPGLEEHIVVQDVTTPETMQRYVLTTEGAPYGWAFTPGQMGFNRLQPRTPIKGLFLTGHWTTPGAGVAGVVMSGQRTVEIIRAREGFQLWRKSA
ncbi:MAG: phytoene desaturase family protein [Anaerolineae bacterium]